MTSDLVPQQRRHFGSRDDAEAIWDAVVSLKNLFDIRRCLCKGELLSVHTLNTYRLLQPRPYDANAPNITAEITSCLPIPFERAPNAGSIVVGEDETFEFGAVEILEMN